MSQQNFLLQTENLSYLISTVQELSAALKGNSGNLDELIAKIDDFQLQQPLKPDILYDFLNDKYNLNSVILSDSELADVPHNTDRVTQLYIQNIKLQRQLEQQKYKNSEMVRLIQQYESCLNKLVNYLREDIIGFHMGKIQATRDSLERLERANSEYHEDQLRYVKLIDFVIKLSGKYRATFGGWNDEIVGVNGYLESLVELKRRVGG